jgi:class 3 adenylate cyclase/tetratricopeptide (TPR) repeat protein
MTPAADPLVSFAPALAVRHFAHDAVPVRSPAETVFQAVTFFADVSGSSALASRLAERGPAGAEELTRVLNAFFGELLALIAAHGGEAVKAAGDALLALWPVAELRGETLADAVRRAAGCALAVRQGLGGDDGFDAGAGHRLAVHVGIGAGEVHALRVGGADGRWAVLAAGDPLRQLGPAVGLAGRAEVVLSPEAWRLVERACDGEPRPNGCVRLTRIRDPLPAEAMEPVAVPAAVRGALDGYLPLPVRARLAAGQADWLAELRRVSVLFVNLLGLDQATSAVLGAAQAVMAVTQAVVARFEGWVKELIVDDKGAVLVVVFGLPPQAHEDDAARCLQAALAIRDALAVSGQRTAMGITTGRVFAGPVGSDRQREYAVVGEAMNRAAHLMGRAGEGILCDEATVRSAGARVALEPLGPVPVKGRRQPLPVWRPAGTADGAAHRGPARLGVVGGQRPLVGRAAERRAVGEALGALTSGTGGVVLVEGEAGIGKSRLLVELLAQAAAARVAALVGAGAPVEQATPYFAWRSVVGRLLGLEGPAPADPGARGAHVLERLSDDPAVLELAPLLRDVVGADIPDTPLTRAMTGEARANRTGDLVSHLLQRATGREGPERRGGAGAARPHLVVLDDAHWLDSASWALTWQVRRQVPALLLVLAARPSSEPPTEYRRLRDDPGTRRLVLDALAPAEAVALVAQRLDVRALPQPVARLIAERAGGNPFFSEELGLALRDGGLLRIADGVCRLAPGEEGVEAVAVPDTVQGIVTSRIDRLPPREQLTLKVASVVGRRFAYRTLVAVHPIAADRPHLTRALARLEQAALTALETSEPDLAYVFTHVITQDVAYGLLPFGRRRQLHRAVAEWLERTAVADPAPSCGQLVYHWRQAGDTARTARYAGLAGERAVQLGAYAEAVPLLEEALRLDAGRGAAPTGADGAVFRRAHRERLLADACYGLGRFSETTEHARRALVLLRRPASRPGLRRTVGIAGQALEQAAHRLLPLAAFAWRSPGRRRWAEEAVRAHIPLAQSSIVAGDPLAFLESTLRALNLAEAAGAARYLPAGWAGMGLFAALIPAHRLARFYFRQARAAEARVDDPLASAWVDVSEGLYRVFLGDWPDATRLLDRAVDGWQRLGDRRRALESQGLLDYVAFCHRGPGPAMPALAAGLARAEAQGDAQIGAALGASLALCQTAAGRGDEALRDLERARSLPLGQQASPEAVFGLHCALAWTKWCGGDTGAAVAARQAADLLGAMRTPHPLVAPLMAALVEVCLSLRPSPVTPSAHGRRWDRVARRATASLRWLARRSRPAVSGTERVLGLSAWCAGDVRHARRHWRASLASAQRLSMPYEEGLAGYELGRHLPVRDPGRRRYLERACALFEQTGAVRDLARARALLVRE